MATNDRLFTLAGREPARTGHLSDSKNSTRRVTPGSSVHDGYFLRASFIAAELPVFKPYNTHCLVFTSKSHFDQGTQYWFVRLK